MTYLTKRIHKILDTPFWPETLDSGRWYFRTHDDNDGVKAHGISVTFSQDGDAFVGLSHRLPGPAICVRYRTFHGGGNSLRVRNALIILAMAIQEDNKEHPI